MWVKDIDLNIGDIVGDLENSPNKVYATIFQVVDIKTQNNKLILKMVGGRRGYSENSSGIVYFHMGHRWWLIEKAEPNFIRTKPLKPFQL